MITRRQLGQAGMTALTGVAFMRLFEIFQRKGGRDVRGHSLQGGMASSFDP